MKNLAIKRIQKMTPYSPPLNGRSGFKGILLDFNERTVQVNKKAIKALEEFIKKSKVQVYPEYFTLREKIAKYVGVEKNQIMLTNGSDNGMDIIFRTFTEAGDKAIIPTPSFAMFYQCASISGNEILTPLYKKEDLSFPENEVLKMIDDRVKIIVICNPNNPTATVASLDTIKKIAEKAKNAVVYVDEAYFEFCGITAAGLIKKYPNIIVTRTFSKAFGLPSLRIGYVVASKTHIDEMMKVRGPYDVNMPAYFAALAVIEDIDEMKNYANEVMQKAKPMVEQFFEKNNVKYYKSGSNFILFKPEKADATYKKLIEKGVLVRPQNRTNIENTLRVSIGTVDQMKKFIDVYRVNCLPRLKKYAFLDRDATLIFEPQDTFQIDSIDKLEILDGAIEGLQKLKTLGYELVMISNQDGLGTKSFPKRTFEEPQNAMLKIFKKNGIEFSKILICPHFKEENCSCRKPKTGLVKDFLKEIDLKNSFMCGDRKTDEEFANNVGIKFVSIPTNGNLIASLNKSL
ncbi:hypothetical protein A2448_01405 [Candidatus Peregrinibacteria bacterium RIFOXYC2_FULL_41_22]|nr:MAG: hypothetical protein A2448_01405 [Candidatus Peregrinibacteria bacterium RIFOXYC2_FULL_41_22]